MKRFHVHVHVSDLAKSVAFYSKLFATEPARTGSWKAWLDGYGTTHTDTLSQSVTLPTGCTNYQFNFYMHSEPSETSTTTNYDTLHTQPRTTPASVPPKPPTSSTPHATPRHHPRP